MTDALALFALLACVSLAIAAYAQRRPAAIAYLSAIAVAYAALLCLRFARVTRRLATYIDQIAERVFACSRMLSRRGDSYAAPDLCGPVYASEDGPSDHAA